VMQPSESRQKKLYAEIISHIKETDDTVPFLQDGYYYYSRTLQGKQYFELCRKKGSLGAPEQVILDLNAMHAAHQQIEQKDAQLREQTATAWLNFYNGLNDQQKTTVSTALKQHFAKMAQRHEKMRERWEKHPGDAAASAVKP